MPQAASTDAGSHQPRKAEMEESIVIDGTPEEIAAAMLEGGAKRKKPLEGRN